MHVDHGRAMDPTLAGAVLGDARDPQPVRGVGHELALHVVLEHRLGALGVPPASAVHTLQPVGAHEPFHALVSAAAVMAQRQFSMDTTDPVCAAGVGMAAMIASSRYASSRSRLLGPRVRLVIARRGDLQHPARHRHRKPLRGEFVDQPETLFWEHVLPREVRRGPFEDLDPHRLDPSLPTKTDQLRPLIPGQALLIGLLRHRPRASTASGTTR